jgi:hypothetical protein
MIKPTTIAYREAASALRAQAAGVKDAKLRDRIERLATDFDQLAHTLERAREGEAKLAGWR